MITNLNDECKILEKEKDEVDRELKQTKTNAENSVLSATGNRVCAAFMIFYEIIHKLSVSHHDQAVRPH